MGYVDCPGGLTIHAGGEILNCNPTMFPCSGGWGTNPSGLPCTWSIRQYADISPNPVTVISLEAWTDVSIAGNLGGIIVLTADATGAYADPTLPPFALIYRNGSLWNGVIDITRKGAGEYSFDMCFADGVWQLGDHGQINVYWTPDGSTWYCRSYFWLVNRLEYETYQRDDGPAQRGAGRGGRAADLRRPESRHHGQPGQRFQRQHRNRKHGHPILGVR